MIAFRDDDEQPSRPRLRDGHQFRGRANLRSLRVRPRTGSPTMRMPLKLRCRSKCNSALRIRPASRRIVRRGTWSRETRAGLRIHVAF